MGKGHECGVSVVVTALRGYIRSCIIISSQATVCCFVQHASKRTIEAPRLLRLCPRSLPPSRQQHIKWRLLFSLEVEHLLYRREDNYRGYCNPSKYGQG